MDPRIADLKSTTFSGRRLTRRQIAEVQKTVALFPHQSRNELAKTICEHLNRVTAKGDYRVGVCMKFLEALERLGILTLPPKRQSKVRDMRSGPAWSVASDRQPELCAELCDLRPLRLEPVIDTEGRQLWNAFVDRHHYLGYKRPFGAHIRYFVADREGRKLGCLLFEAATKTLPCRDRWIGWSDRARGRKRQLLVVNSRFLVLPWVRSKNLASSALALAARRLADDWQRLHGYRPVLCETFVDESRFRASCYRAAYWARIGSTGGKSAKGVYVLPLRGGAREILRGERDAEKPAKPPRRAERGRSAASDRRFPRRWETLVAAATAVAEREDARWQKRRRVFNSLLIMLFVLRLVVAPRGQGYRATLCELWEQCAAAGVELPQDEPPAASTACDAREKLDERAFKALHREILANSPDGPLWKDHRVLAVDGSKLTLPRELAQLGYRIPDGAHDPQGMVSAMYRLKTASRSTSTCSATKTNARLHLPISTMPPKATSSSTTEAISPSRWLRPTGSADRTSCSALPATPTQPSKRSSPRGKPTGSSPSNRPATARPARAFPSAWPGMLSQTPITASPPPCSTAAAIPSRHAATSITADGESRNSTRPARP